MTRKKKTVLITGATGLIGRHLCRRFLERGDEVRALVRDAEEAKKDADFEGAVLSRCVLPDVLDPKMFEGADVLTDRRVKVLPFGKTQVLSPRITQQVAE